jgi:acetylxylan esterase
MVVYPSSPRSGTCFDVNTNATLTHNGGGDSQGIASMVTYSIANYGVSASHVFVTGSSSGAMMTNVMVN